MIFILDYASSLCSTCILLRFASSLLSPFFFIFVPSFASLMLMFTFLCVLLIVVQILCDHVPVSTPRVAVNIALVIGSLCSVRGLYSQIYVITNYMVWCIWSFCHLFYHSCPILVSIVILVSPLTLKQMHSYGCSNCLWMICYFNLIGFILSYCQIVPPTAHLVISSASDFLLKWLFQYEHEHQQWSAALSLGLIFNCFHPTDKKSRFQVINGLLEVWNLTLCS